MQAQKNDELARYKLENSIGLDNAKIAGRNQAVENIYRVIGENKIQEADKQSLILVMKTMNNKGVLSRADLELLKKYNIDPNTGVTE